MPTYKAQDQLAAAIPRLTRAQLRHIAELLTGLSRAEAAAAQGIKSEAVYHWPSLVQRVAEIVRADPEEAARQVFKLALLKAALIKVAALDSDNEATRQKAASEIIEGLLGRSYQRQESTREQWLAELAAEAAEFRLKLEERLLTLTAGAPDEASAPE